MSWPSSSIAAVVSPQRLYGGDRAVVLDLKLAPGRRSSECAADGQLGMDVLRACRLVLADDRLVARYADR